MLGAGGRKRNVALFLCCVCIGGVCWCVLGCVLGMCVCVDWGCVKWARKPISSIKCRGCIDGVNTEDWQHQGGARHSPEEGFSWEEAPQGFMSTLERREYS